MDANLLRNTVQYIPDPAEANFGTLMITFANTASEIEPWGRNWARRDKQLREFITKEPFLKSTVYNIATTRSALPWELDGPPKTVAKVQKILNSSDFGRGWTSLMMKVAYDLMTQDNGSFIEIIRNGKTRNSPVVGLAHLDAAKCLSGDTRVLFEDGSTMSIREIVRHKYGGYVMSISPEGKLEPKRITNFYETSLGNRYWIKIKLSNPKRAFGRSQKLTLTNDHEILTNIGWKTADQIIPGDLVATNYRDFSRNQKELLVGTLLGDGFISKHSRSKKNTGKLSCLQFSHAEKQEEWLDTKIKALQGFNWSEKRTNYRKIISVNSEYNPSIGKLRDKFYIDNTKIVPFDLVEEYMSPRLLASWFMDDGNKQVGKWGRPKGRLYTNNFTKKETERLVSLLNNYGVECSIRKTKSQKTKGINRSPYYYWIYITADGFERLSEIISPYVVPSMRYKLSDKADILPFNPTLWDMSSEIYFDEVVSVEKTDNGKQTATFCIDVEDNHNFVAAGTIVHNCVRTGNPQYPVIYTDANGGLHKLPWWRIITLEESPHPQEEQRNRQICFVSRVLEGARVIADIATYKEEKVSGRFAKAIHLVGGVAKHEIDNAQRAADIDADNAGLTRYIQPILLAALDPTARVSHEKIELASLPDHFDEDTTMKWYITLLALASGGDFQDLAPLPGGNLGTASQSDTLHRKSRVKGIQLWMKLIEHKLHHYNIIPSSVTFSYAQEDSAAEAEKEELSHRRAQKRKLMIDSGEINESVARRMAVDEGDLKPEYLMVLEEEPMENVTTTVRDDETVSDELIELEDESVDFEKAVKVANQFMDLITFSPVNAMTPLSPYKLVTFYQELVKEIETNNLTTVYTTDGWLAPVLVKCAFNSNILPISIKQRLPDNYQVKVIGGNILDNRNNIIFKQVKKEKPVEEIKCRVCGEKGYKTYQAFRGFTTSCEKHHVGIKCDDIDSLIENFKTTSSPYPADQFLTAIMCAYEIGRGKKLNFGKVGETLRKEVESHKIIMSNKTLQVNAILKWYMKGLQKRL